MSNDDGSFAYLCSRALEDIDLVDKAKRVVDWWWDMVLPMEIDYVADPPSLFIDLASLLCTRLDLGYAPRFLVEYHEYGKEGPPRSMELGIEAYLFPN